MAALLGSCSSACTRDGEYECVRLPRAASTDVIAFARVFPEIELEGAIDLIQTDDGARWYLATQLGVVYTFASADASADASVALDLRDRVIVDGEAGLLGVALHPAFADDGELFVSYTTPGDAAFVSRVSRFRSPDGGRTFDPDSERIVLEVDQPYTNHNGGALGFGPDGYLYFGLGDGGAGSDPLGHGQNTDTLLGAMLRIDVDGAEPYAIPPDNPFAAGGGAPELYAWGLRNPWRWSFDRETGELWVGDVGQNLWEEIDRVELGGNYGWNVKEGATCFGADVCDDAALIDPVAQYLNTGVASVIAGHVYRGQALPELSGQMIYSDFYSGTVWGVREGEEPLVLSASGGRQVTDYAVDRAGELYATTFAGGIYRIVAAPAPDPKAATLPTDLFATGCVDPDDPLAPADGLIGYVINAAFWSDGADKQRWLSLPRRGRISVGEDGDWELPPGSVIVKSFEIGEGEDRRLIETRLLARHDDGGWAGYSYAWDEAGQATLVDAAGELREFGAQTWIYPSRAGCLFCHGSAAGRSLGLESAQLDRDGQLAGLVELGVLDELPAGHEPLVDPHGDAALDARARAYLHSNCAPCHRPDGPEGRARLDLRATTPLADLGLCEASPRAGDLGITDAVLLAPGEPARSIVSARLHSTGTSRMPPLGSAVIDVEGAALIDAWITSLTACP